MVYSAAAFAEPVTKDDLAGKKICWSNGGIATYAKDGSFEGNFLGHRTWNLDGDQLTENGVMKFTARIAKGGKLHFNNTWGKVCN